MPAPPSCVHCQRPGAPGPFWDLTVQWVPPAAPTLTLILCDECSHEVEFLLDVLNSHGRVLTRLNFTPSPELVVTKEPYVA